MKNWIGIVVLGCLVGGVNGAEEDPDLIFPKEVVEAVPSVGKVRAYNPLYGFFVADITTRKEIRVGTRLAVRRNDHIIVTGTVEAVEGQTKARRYVTVVVDKPYTVLDAETPHLRDDIIMYPPSSFD